MGWGCVSGSAWRGYVASSEFVVEERVAGYGMWEGMKSERVPARMPWVFLGSGRAYPHPVKPLRRTGGVEGKRISPFPLVGKG